MLEQVLEGTWEEIAQHADELAGKRVRLTVVEEAPAAVQPNEAMLEAMRKIKERSKDMPFTSGEDTRRLLRETTPVASDSQPNEAALQVMEQVAQLQSGMRYTSGADTQQLLREARAGAMYGYDPRE